MNTIRVSIGLDPVGPDLGLKVCKSYQQKKLVGKELKETVCADI